MKKKTNSSNNIRNFPVFKNKAALDEEAEAEDSTEVAEEEEGEAEEDREGAIG